MTACSLNEIQVYGLRAARGAGMPWGLAEEAGAAARWLAARGLPGVELLAGLLHDNDGRAYAELAPDPGTVWRARAGTLCPVSAGAALADRLTRLGAIELVNVAYPLLLLPFLAGHDGPPSSFELRWDRVLVVAGARGHRVRAGDPEALSVAATARVGIAPGPAGEAPVPVPVHAGSVAVADAAWRVLQTLASRIYVPASDASRRRGAGASIDDND